jgi:type I site-specific restriction endonuclease
VFDFCQNFEFFNQNPNITDAAVGPSLGEKLFIARVELIGEIDNADFGDGIEPMLELRGDVATRLFEEESGMSLDNFIVRPKRRFVKKYQARDAWKQLGFDDRAELAKHGDHITIRKLRRNEQLTPQDLAELERIFTAEGVASDEDLERIREEGGLGLFIRSLVRLDPEAAKSALDAFMKGRKLIANQIEFINLVIDHLTERGTMDPHRLYQSPFTDLDDQGVAPSHPAGEAQSAHFAP